MRRTRIFTIVLFVIAAAAFAVSQVMQMMTDKSGPAISMDRTIRMEMFPKT